MTTLTKRHPFAAVNKDIAATMTRDNLVDWLVWMNGSGQRPVYVNLNKEQLTKLVQESLCG